MNTDEIEKRHHDLGTNTMHCDGVVKIWVNHYLNDVGQLLQANKIMHRALGFYADPNNYTYVDSETEIATEAIKQVNELDE